jgi:outer membrane protein assembly factor BamB
VKIVREWDGEGSNDQFGWIARSIGDVDRDGVPDFVTSAPTKNLGGQNAGRVYVYSTRTGKLIWNVDGKPGDQLGIGVEAAGDVNRDGIPDVVASAPGAGKAYIFSGKDGRVLVTMTAEDPSDNFGRHVAGAGDVNRDGYADVIIGAPAPTTGEEQRMYIPAGTGSSCLPSPANETEISSGPR